jgi:phosphatidylglycerophosphate synthase
MPAMSPPRRTTRREMAAAGRPRGGWWTATLLEPAAAGPVRLLAHHTPITPDQLTAVSAMLTVAAAGGMLEGERFGLIAGSLLFQLSLLVDCMGGMLARLTGTVTELGAWFGAVAGRARFVMCASALLVGEYARTEDRTCLLLTALVFSCYAVVQISDGQAGRIPGGFARVGTARPARRTRGARTIRRRPFARPVTEVEFGTAVCVLAPQTGAYVVVIVVASVLLLVGELSDLTAAVRLFLGARSSRTPLGAALPGGRYGVAEARSQR